LNIVFFTFYYPPDLCAGSFRAKSLTHALSRKLNNNDELHVITTHPNRYASHKQIAKSIEQSNKVTVHRVTVPEHQGDMYSQAKMFIVYAFAAYKICKKINPNFIIGTTSRLMTGVLTSISAYRLKCKYFIDLRDIFSETISDIFSHKNKLFGVIFKALFSFIEKIILNNASGVNVVSEGFLEYFQEKKINTSRWSFFPNGVDKEFQDLQISNNKSSGVKTVLYAGNIGDGQGLETILPAVAKKIGNDYHFLIIGDGGARKLLEKDIKDNKIKNIKILPPVNRSELIRYYHEADILFLHLNNIPAFYRVLPSKIFEYVAFGKPIIAGISGYSAKFMKDNISHAIVFNPGNVNQCVNSIKSVESVIIDKDQINMFIDKYSREKIMEKMASHILTIL